MEEWIRVFKQIISSDAAENLVSRFKLGGVRTEKHLFSLSLSHAHTHTHFLVPLRAMIKWATLRRRKLMLGLRKGGSL